jgi:hypothetical protein
LIDDKPIGTALNRNLGSPMAPGEAVEGELERLIERHSQQRDPDEESELWRQSVRAYEEKRRQMVRLKWHLHHTAQAERLRRTPYTDAYRAMERERIEGEVHENRERDRAEVELLNSPEVRGITGV